MHAGVWFAISSKLTVAAAPTAGVLVLLHLLRGEGLGWLEGSVYLALVAGLLTEMAKVVRSMGGGGG
jgi:hypothetical protein